MDYKKDRRNNKPINKIANTMSSIEMMNSYDSTQNFDEYYYDDYYYEDNYVEGEYYGSNNPRNNRKVKTNITTIIKEVPVENDIINKKNTNNNYKKPDFSNSKHFFIN